VGLGAAHAELLMVLSSSEQRRDAQGRALAQNGVVTNDEPS
jgi:hypothetical protein